MQLDNKVILVTGSATGIGKAIVLEAARQGAHTVVNYIGPSDPADAVVQEIQRGGGQALGISADVSNSADVHRMVDEAIQKFGKIDVLVNNAGIELSKPFLDKTEADWDRVIAVDLKGPFLCSQAVAREMVKRKQRGTIINISSVHEEIGFPGYSAYCSAKGGLRMLCRNLALELAPYNINIVNVAPGAIATPINRGTLNDPQKKAALEKEIPLHRIGTPDEVAHLVCFLASDQASYITGTTVCIDGGLMRQTGSL